MKKEKHRGESNKDNQERINEHMSIIFIPKAQITKEL